jgi:protein-tyrosine phosphatase
MPSSMPYAPLLLLAAALFGALGGLLWLAGHPWGLIFAYPALSFLLVGIGYLGWGAWMLGKRTDGTRHWWGYLLSGPFLVLMRLGRELLWRLNHREPVYDEVAPGIYVGRWPRRAGLPEGVTMVVDLTSELNAAPCIRSAPEAYVCLPTLDGSAPSGAALHALLERIAEHDGPVYVHCAAGHGRSAMFAAMLLVSRGHAADVAAAVAMMKRSRPKVRLVPTQARRATEALALRGDPS